MKKKNLTDGFDVMSVAHGGHAVMSLVTDHVDVGWLSIASQ